MQRLSIIILGRASPERYCGVGRGYRELGSQGRVEFEGMWVVLGDWDVQDVWCAWWYLYAFKCTLHIYIYIYFFYVIVWPRFLCSIQNTLYQFNIDKVYTYLSWTYVPALFCCSIYVLFIYFFGFQVLSNCICMYVLPCLLMHSSMFWHISLRHTSSPTYVVLWYLI